jgi:DNA-binding CsgD family transcriptional regulator
MSRPAVIRYGRALDDLEVEVLRWIALGKSDKDIGEIMRIPTRTVKTTAHNIFLKLNAANRAGAVTIGFAQGILDLESFR